MVRRPPSASIPDAPGVYLFKDGDGRVLYVGKAKSLRKRTASYFGRGLGPRTRSMVQAAEELDWLVTDSEVAALMLEFTLVQKHQPRFNIRLRDDKSFPYLAITRNQEWPRVMVMRGKRRKGVQYFGPYAHAYAIRQTRDLLLRTFPIRSCTDQKFRSHEALGRPCLLFHIERCSGPCVGEVDRETYEQHIDGFAGFLDGNGEEVIDELEQEMGAAAEELEYEKAARFRDQLTAVRKAMARQELVTQSKDSFDLIAIEEDDLEAALIVLTIKRGRVTGTRSMVIDKVEDVTTAELFGIMIGQLYGKDEPPREVLVQEMPDNPELWQEWLVKVRGGPVTIRVPQRGAKRRLMETAQANAAEEFGRHRLKRSTDHNSRAKALRSLQEELGLDRSPLRIEAYDISTIQGLDTVGSMVVFEDALPKKSDYRRFKIKRVSGQDDFAAMEEMLDRRFAAYVIDRKKPIEERGKFSYPPSLIVIDGGLGQLGRAVKILAKYELDIPVIGLAKRLEEVYRPGSSDPLLIPRGQEALYLLQRVRDEAHRFAVAYHRTLRGKRMVDSILDSVPGVGPGRKKKLLRRFGSLKQLRAAELTELAEVVPGGVAVDLYEALQSGPNGASPPRDR
ncbi:MAG: excinuclease ABC subunit UvrC [Acidimicrobiia bacterium]|nr:excinuclease ABC subunit UvrC [Acidimicrobiia bacterium]